MPVFRRRIAGLNNEQVMHAMGIDDAYRVERVLARGPNGVTERVTIEGAGPFIRKKLPTALANRAVWAALAANTCARLPQVAATYEMPDWFVVVYDDVPGETLAELVGRSGALDELDALQIARDLCEATAALHACGIMHLDISPANIVIAADGAHLIDFGNARIINGGPERPHAAQRPLGTWGFAAPEQFFSKASPRSDIYALGRVLGCMLTGITPDADNQDAFEEALEKSGASVEALRIVERASAFEAGMRYQSVDELASALGECQRSESHRNPAALKRESASQGERVPAEFTWERAKARRPWLRIAAVVTVACALIAVAIAWRAARAGDGVDGEPSAQAPDPVGEQTDKAPALSEIDEPSEGDLQRAYKSLEFVELGWDVDGQGYVHYAMAFKNKSENLVIRYPSIQITGRKDDGAIAFTNEQVLSVIYPGETVRFGCQAGNGVVPSDVEFSFNRPQGHQVNVGAGEASRFTVDNVSDVQDGAGACVFTGEVSLEHDGGETFSMDEVWVTIALRDQAGNIIAGYNGFAKRPAPGERTSFEIQVYDCPDYASVDVFTMAW